MLAGAAVAFACASATAVVCAQRLRERLALNTKAYAFIVAVTAVAVCVEAACGRQWNEPSFPALVVGCVCAYTDLQVGYIFDGVLALGAALTLAATASTIQLEGAVVGACAAGLLPLALFGATRGRALALGDVKLAMLLGAATGLRGVAEMLAVAAMTGGVVACLLLAARRRSRSDTIPFAPFLTLGAWAAVSGVGT